MPHPGFRLGIYVFKEAEIVDFAAPHGVFSVARRFDPELEAFTVAEALRPVQAQAGFTVLPNYGFSDRPAMDAFLIPGGFGTRTEINNARLHEYVRAMDEGRDAIEIDRRLATWRWVRGYVEDVAHAICLAVTDERAAGRTYNVCEPVAFSEQEWVRRIANDCVDLGICVVHVR